MQRRFILVLVVVLTAFPALLFGQDEDFDAFFTSFRDAVMAKDTATLDRLMAADFDFIRTNNVSHQFVFDGLNVDGGKEWLNLQDSVQRTPVPFETAPYLNARVIQCTPPQPRHSCLVVFQRDSSKQWRWKAMIMPRR